MRKTPVTPHSSLSVISKTQATGYQKLVGITIKKKVVPRFGLTMHFSHKNIKTGIMLVNCLRIRSLGQKGEMATQSFVIWPKRHL